MNEEIALLRRYAASGDEPAFAELVRCKVNLVYSVALRQAGGDTHLAEEITQTVFIDLARKAGSLTRHTSLTGWLHTATRFAGAKAVRARQRWQRHEEARPMDEIESASPRDPEWARLGPVLDAALGELDARDREVLLLRYFENRPFAEVGAGVGLSENSARMRTERALDKLRLRLARRGIASTSSALALAFAQQAVTAAPAGLAAAATGAALAGSAVSGGAGSLLSLLMASQKTSTALIAILGLATIAALGFQFRTDRELRALSGDLERRNSENAALRSENRRLQTARAVSPEPGAAPATAPADETASANFTVSSGGRAGVAFAPATYAFRSVGADDPEMKRLMEVQQRGQIERRYGSLLQGLGLTPEQRDQFIQQLLQRQNAGQDAMTAALAKGLPPQELQAQIDAARTAALADSDAALRTLLGNDGYRQWESYQSSLPHRELAEQLASRLSTSTEPLQPGQMEQLVKMFAETSPLPAEATQDFGANRMTFQSSAEGRGATQARVMVTNDSGPGAAVPVTDGLLAQAQTVLSPAQLSALRQLQTEQAAAQALQKRMLGNLQVDMSPEKAN